GSSEVANTLMLLPHNLQLIVQPTGANTCGKDGTSMGYQAVYNGRILMIN
ncbi:hypothetical protein BV898_14685, partial [Hypsibius exemplaris]